MKLDPRYTVTREWCGWPFPRFVARFCGYWLGQSETRAGALVIAKDAKAKRLAN